MYFIQHASFTILTVIAKLKVKLFTSFTQTFSACCNSRLIQATILNNIFTVVSLYAPNNNDPALCHTFSLKLLQTSTAFDTVLNTLIDRSSNSANIRHSQSAKNNNRNIFGGCWKTENCNKQGVYSFLSSTSIIFLKIFFFLQVILFLKTVSEYILSEHTPLTADSFLIIFHNLISPC